MSIPLKFKSAKDFFEYSCQYGRTEVKANRGLVAIILDARSEYGTSEAVRTDANGHQWATICVASKDGGFRIPAATPNPGEPLVPNDLVIWFPMSHSLRIAWGFKSWRSGWVGPIVAKIAPELDTNGRLITIARHTRQ